MKRPYKFSLATATVAASLALAVIGCHSGNAQNQTPVVAQNGVPANGDPAAANMAPVGGAVGFANTQQQPTRVLGQSQQNEAQQQATQYGNGTLTPPPAGQGGGAPIVRQAPSAQQGQQQQGYYDPNAQGNTPIDDASNPAYNDLYTSDVDTYATQAPPPLPEYDQPPPPEDDYMWTPGYWGWGAGGYYWVPGAWCAPPYVGALWTPGWWGFYGGRYGWHRGYWGRYVGFYGGVPYGFGYTGIGFFGGYWGGGHFFYNRDVVRVGGNIRNVYSRPVPRENFAGGRASFNGPGGINRRPTGAEVAAFHNPHTGPMGAQIANAREAQANRGNAFSENHGRPAMAVAQRGLAADHGVAAAPRIEGNTQRGGFGGNAAGRPGEPAAAARNANEQQRNVNEQQRNQNLQQRDNNLQQRNANEQQRNVNEQQRNQNLQQRDNNLQQRNVQEQQRNAQEQQRNAQVQQQNVQRQQQVQQQNVQRQQQMQQQNVQRQQQMQQARPEQQVRPQQAQPQARPMEQPHAAPQAAPHAAPAPAAHPAPAPHPAGGGGGGGGHHPH